VSEQAQCAPLRVLVADDSPAARQLLVHILTADPALSVAAEARDGAEAVRLVERVRPAVVVMDVLMPGLDGLAATRRIMETRPTPIVLVSAEVDVDDLNRSFEALRAGALVLLRKPPGPGHPHYPAEAATLTTTVQLMADVKVVRRHCQRLSDPNGAAVGVAAAPDAPAGTAAAVTGAARGAPVAAPRTTAGAVRAVTPTLARTGQPRIIAVAASTGGPAALATLLAALGADPPPVPIVVVQHIVAGFDQGLASWLDEVSPLPVDLATDGHLLRPGEVVLAPAHLHLGVTATGRAGLSPAPPIGPHRPSATYLFRSVARAYADGAVGVVLTGMGDDGAAGLRSVKDAGGLVLAQDESTSVVYGMPAAAVAAGAVDHTLPLDQIPAALTLAWRRYRS
jgi:two-component system, chemotaxis family, protein-glutamate methylesterase/glutaminase